MPEIHVDDVGTRLIATFVDQDGTVIDISAATKKTLRIVNTVDLETDMDVTYDVSFVTDGTDGKVYYELVAADTDEAGEHFKREWHYETASVKFTSDPIVFAIKENL